MRRTTVLACTGLALVAGAAGIGGLACFGGGPLGLLPGGRLSGEVVGSPIQDWAFAASHREVQLEVAPERARSVTIWSVVLDGALYVSADFLTPFKRWPHQVLADPRVRVRIRGRVYPCRATRVVDPERIERLRRAFARKYDLRPDGLAARAEVWFFRLESAPDPRVCAGDGRSVPCARAPHARAPGAV